MFPWGNYNALVVLRDGDAGHDENSVDQLCQPKKYKDKDEYMRYENMILEALTQPITKVNYSK